MSATKRDIAYKRIKEMILQGDLTSEFTPSEKSLGDELGMSRTPVREALQRLVMEGFMKGCSHKGSMVNEISIAEAVEIVELRMAVEEFVIQNLSLPLSDEQCAKLQAMVDYCHTNDCLRGYILKYFGESGVPEKCSACGNCTNEIERVDITLDAQKILSCVYRMARLYGNQLLRDTLKSARERFLAPGGVILRNKPQMLEALEGHVKILGALRKGDSEEAKRQMHAHMVFAKHVLIS